jgi:putative ABC transport system ATP-binding protein
LEEVTCVAVVLENLRKRYVGPDGVGVPVVDVPSFRLEGGEQVALVGSSGSGKTTLLHLIAGILTPDSGKVEYDVDGGRVDVAKLSEAERDVFRGRHLGYIFQTHHLLGGFTAMENVLLGMSFTGRKHDLAWAKHLLEEVGLGQRLDYKPGKLSVGQQQRVAVARALANRPSVVLADEPTGALDVNNARQVLELIKKLCAEVGASLLLVTHDPEVMRGLPRAVNLAEMNRAAAETVRGQ